MTELLVLELMISLGIVFAHLVIPYSCIDGIDFAPMFIMIFAEKDLL